MESIKKNTEVRLAKKEDLWKVSQLAQVIFPFTYQDIVPAEQIDYMMDMFYKPENLIAQFESGQIFLIIYSEEKPAGYASFTALDTPAEFKLNKIYLDHRLQGYGLGKTLIDEVVFRVRAAGGKRLQLNVNKHNRAVGFYRRMGFSVKESVLLDIGQGYFMDDYVMELSI